LELHQRPQAARGALLRFECLSKTRGTQAFGAWPRSKAMRGVFGLAPLFPGGPPWARGNKAVAFHNPQAMYKKKPVVGSCAHDPMAVARPPVLTPPMTLSALSCE
jgi:hypothetical protein